jgi:LPXTG-motif cell wall-anchored protein
MNRRIALALALAVALSLALFGTAAAHAKLVSSTPAAGTKLTAAPAKITIVLSEEVSEKETDSYFVVTNEQGTEAGRGKLDNADIDHKTLSGTLNSGAGDGVYTVTWYALTPDDNGKSSGSFTFGVNKDPGAQPTAAPHDEAEPTAASAAQPTATGSAAQPTAAAAHNHDAEPGTLPKTGAGDTPLAGIFLVVALLLVAGGLVLRRSRNSAR